MSVVSIVLKQLFGLFVDDGSLAIAILAWIGLIAALLKFAVLAPAVCGGLLFVGLAALLIENLWRTAKK